MESVTVNLPDQLAMQIEEAAKKMGVSPEDFIKAGIEEKLSLLNRNFHEAIVWRNELYVNVIHVFFFKIY